MNRPGAVNTAESRPSIGEDYITESRPASTTHEHFADLDGLRGLLALSVVLLHYGINALIQRATGGALKGFAFQLSVDFFFVLSGFVLTYSLSRGPSKPWAFAVKRCCRLLPIYYLTLAAMMGLAAVATRSAPYLPLPLGQSRVLMDALIVSSLAGRETINVPAWSVGWELALPVVAVFVAPVIAPRIGRRSLVLVIASGIGLSWAAYAVAGGAHLYGLRAALGLLAGACLFAARPRWKVPPSYPLLAPLVAALMGVMLGASNYPALAIAYPWLAMATVLVGSRTRTLLSSRGLSWLGRISFTLYMVHVPVLVAAYVFFGAAAARSAPFKCGALLVSLALAWLLSLTVERWGISLGRRLAVQLEGPSSACL